MTLNKQKPIYYHAFHDGNYEMNYFQMKIDTRLNFMSIYLRYSD